LQKNNMPESALPEHLRDKYHDDWIFPFCFIPRGWTAFKWSMPPRCLIGYNVMRWDTAERGDWNIWEYACGKGWIFWKKPVMGHVYGPNAIQKIQGTWRISFHISYPLGFHMTIKLWKYKEATTEELARGYDGVRLIYLRFGARFDSYDSYYSFPSFFIGLTYN